MDICRGGKIQLKHKNIGFEQLIINFGEVNNTTQRFFIYQIKNILYTDILVVL